MDSAAPPPENIASERGLNAVTENVQSGAFDRLQIIDLCRNNLNFLAAFLMPTVFTLFFPALHQAVWEMMKEAVANSEKPSPPPKEKFPQIAIGWPRGFAKTTLVKLFVVFCILFTKKKFILVVAANLTKAQNIVSDICSMLGEDNVRETFGSYNADATINRLDLKRFDFMGRNIILAAIGSGGDPRGINLGNDRPDIILMDDMQSKENAESVLQSKELLNWMTATLMKAKSPHGCVFLYIGNKFSANGTILKILQKNPQWRSVIVGGILADGTSLWPEFRSTEELMEEFRSDIAMNTPEAFIAEIMNDDTASITADFDITRVPFCPIAEEHPHLGSFILIDVAGAKRTSDDTTIMRYKWYGESCVCEELLAEILTPGDTIKQALMMALKNDVPVIAVESVAYQSSLLFWFTEVCKAHNIEGIHFVEVFPRGRPKPSRIITMFKTLIGSSVSGVATKPTLYLRESVKPKVFWEVSQYKPAKADNIDNILDNLGYVQDVIQDYSDLIMSAFPTEDRIFYESAKVRSANTSF